MRAGKLRDQVLNTDVMSQFQFDSLNLKAQCGICVIFHSAFSDSCDISCDIKVKLQTASNYKKKFIWQPVLVNS